MSRRPQPFRSRPRQYRKAARQHGPNAPRHRRPARRPMTDLDTRCPYQPLPVSRRRAPGGVPARPQGRGGRGKRLCLGRGATSLVIPYNADVATLISQISRSAPATIHTSFFAHFGTIAKRRFLSQQPSQIEQHTARGRCIRGGRRSLLDCFTGEKLRRNHSCFSCLSLPFGGRFFVAGFLLQGFCCRGASVRVGSSSLKIEQDMRVDLAPDSFVIGRPGIIAE
jgi:hypothetical protein